MIKRSSRFDLDTKTGVLTRRDHSLEPTLPSAFYANAAMSRNGEHATSGHKPSYNVEDNKDRIALIASARQLENDFAPIGYAFSEITKYIVPKDWRANTGDEETDLILTRFIETELEAERFDYAQDDDGPSCWRQLVRDGFTDGDSFQRYVIPRGEDTFMCQSIRADLIGSISGSDDIFASLRNGKLPKIPDRYRLVGGAIIDGRGRRIWWQKFREAQKAKGILSSDGGYEFERNIPARSTSQYYDRDHSDQFRGVTPLRESAGEYRDLQVTWEYVRRNMEHAASIAAVITNEDGVADPSTLHPKHRRPEFGPDSQANGACPKCATSPCHCPPSVQEINGLRLHHLKFKEKMEQFKSEQPSARFQDAARHLLQVGAWSVKMPYGILFDSKDLNGAPMRFEISKAGCSITDMRMNTIKRLPAPWLRGKILEGIQRGVLPFKVSQLSALTKGKWGFAETPTSDERYKSATYLALLEKGALSIDDVCEARGTTSGEVRQENKRFAAKVYQDAKAAWEKSGKELELSWWIDMLSMRNANGSMVHLASRNEPTPNIIPENDDD